MKPLSRWKLFAFGSIAVGGSIMLALVGAELVVRLFAPHRTLGSLIVADPVFGYRMLKNAATHYFIEGRYVGIRTNAQGLRQDDVIPKTRGKEKRALVLGDSFAFGWGVELEESFVHRLSTRAKEKLTPDEWLFINAGHGGWGTAHMLAYLEREGLAFQPDIALLFMGHNDLEDNERNPVVYRQTSETDLVVDESLLATQNNQSFLAKHFPIYQWLRFHSYLVQMYRADVVEGLNQIQNRVNRATASTPLRAPLAAVPPPAPRKIDSTATPKAIDQPTKFTRALILRAKADLDARGIPLLVLSVGTGSARTVAFWKENASWLRDHGINFHDLTEAIRQKTSGDIKKNFLMDGHFTAEGNRVYAEEAWPIVKAALVDRSTKRRPN